VDIASISQIKAGGRFLLMVKPQNEIMFAEVIRQLNKRSIYFKPIGNLSNVLFRDGDIRSIAISTRNLTTVKNDGDGVLTVGAGVMLPAFAHKMVYEGYKGFAGIVGIPASVGGAVYMNASSYHDCISQYLESVCCIDPSGNIHHLEKKELGISWRHSAFHDRYHGWTIVSVSFRLEQGDPATECERMVSVRQHRKAYQESGYPNLGSTFATTDIYGDLASHFYGYRLGFFLLRVLNRLIPGDKHHHFALMARWFTKKYFNLQGNERIDYSRSTFNCIVNKGRADANEIIAFVEKTYNAINRSIKLEIELVKDIE
ncbi:MAG: FAD-binding protein, partial [Chlorobiaceae bacterium]